MGPEAACVHQAIGVFGRIFPPPDPPPDLERDMATFMRPQRLLVSAGVAALGGAATATLLAGSISFLLAAGAGLLVHIDLLHNLGFFPHPGAPDFANSFAMSNELQRWFDGFVTAAVVAAGAKPIHDLISKLTPGK